MQRSNACTRSQRTHRRSIRRSILGSAQIMHFGTGTKMRMTLRLRKRNTVYNFNDLKCSFAFFQMTSLSGLWLNGGRYKVKSVRTVQRNLASPRERNAVFWECDINVTRIWCSLRWELFLSRKKPRQIWRESRILNSISETAYNRIRP